jgi:uncharacterized membrane protein YfcA
VVPLFSLPVILALLVGGLVMAYVEGSHAHKEHQRRSAPEAWISFVLCGVAAGLIGGLLNVAAFSLGRRAAS